MTRILGFIIFAMLFVGCKKESTLYDENILLKNSIETYILAKEELTEKQARILEIAHYKKPYGNYNLIRKLNGKELIHVCNGFLTPAMKTKLLTDKYEVYDWELGDYSEQPNDYISSSLHGWRNYGAEHYDEIVAWEYSIYGTFCTKQGFVYKEASLLIVLFKGMLIINK